MPNWCDNTLLVDGEEEAVYRWVEEAASLQVSDPQPLHFEAFIVPPSHLAGDDLLHWRILNWGTKWEPKIMDFVRAEGWARYRFDTAWSPPVDWLLTASKKYPELSFCIFYVEGGMNFAGEVEIRDGEITRSMETTADQFFSPI